MIYGDDEAAGEKVETINYLSSQVVFKNGLIPTTGVKTY